ncbi:Transmembrane_domain-containing protein [Hexamita inflata]|uniref:Transmembrane domain-containing protein n=1 Tax=Hexamita inflata TaxID=28002 RepID=A0AA86UXS2_9EUKA|nr:Transmembrane domain-containing protein [Hexamita inflata]
MQVKNYIVIPLVVSCGFLTYQKIYRYLPQSIFRKLVHLITGMVYIKIIPYLFSECKPIQAFVPISFLVCYVGLLTFKPQLAKYLGRNNGIYPYGIIEYIVMFSVYPLLSCDDKFGRSLMCLLGGDGLAGVAQYFDKSHKTFLNPNKSYLGFMFCFFGSLAYLWFYSHEINYKLAFVASIAELIPLQQHDNVFITLITYLFQLYLTKTTYFLLFCCIMSVFYVKRKFTPAGAVTGVLIIFAHFLLSISAFQAVLAFGVLGTLSSSFKKRKCKNNNDSEKEVKNGRSAFQVIDNSIISLILAVMYQISGDPGFELAAVAASAECLADTWASDFGVTFKGKTYSPLMKLTKSGINGGISLIGSIMAVIGAVVCSLVYINEFDKMIKVIIAAVLGCWTDSILGWFLQASYEINGKIQNEYTEGAVNIGGKKVFSNGTINILASLISAIIGKILMQ